MNIYFLPSLLSLAFNLFVLAYVIRGGSVSRVFTTIVVVFAIHNGIEFFGYLLDANPATVETMFRLYYVATVFVMLYMLLYALSVSKLESLITTSISIGIATVLSCLILFFDSVVAGVYSIGYSVSATKGEYYNLFSLYIFSTLLLGFITTYIGHLRAKSELDSMRCLHSLLALTPITLVFATAMIFKILNIGINATGLVPIATALFLAIMLKTESRHKLSNLRRLLPLSLERQTTARMMDLLDEYIKNAHKEDVYKDLQSGIEKEIINYSLKKCENNVTSTAKLMGLKNRSTLYSMINRLDIDLEELKTVKSKNS
ncbi:MAG: hypothetical protein MK188_11435 [Gammaproteobacteria bacterium]|nr:hypothetical protein [Gammaproteobacteria bacterium]